MNWGISLRFPPRYLIIASIDIAPNYYSFNSLSWTDWFGSGKNSTISSILQFSTWHIFSIESRDTYSSRCIRVEILVPYLHYIISFIHTLYHIFVEKATSIPDFTLFQTSTPLESKYLSKKKRAKQQIPQLHNLILSP